MGAGIRVTVYGLKENDTENDTENRLELIINKIKENNSISLNQLANVLSVSRITIIRDIEKLKEKGKIKRIGPDKGGHWELTTNKKQETAAGGSSSWQ